MQFQRPKGGDMKHTHRLIDRRVQAVRKPAMIRFVSGKRG
jgi:hypothetical protein